MTPMCKSARPTSPLLVPGVSISIGRPPPTQRHVSLVHFCGCDTAVTATEMRTRSVTAAMAAATIAPVLWVLNGPQWSLATRRSIAIARRAMSPQVVTAWSRHLTHPLLYCLAIPPSPRTSSLSLLSQFRRPSTAPTQGQASKLSRRKMTSMSCCTLSCQSSLLLSLLV